MGPDKIAFPISLSDPEKAYGSVEGLKLLWMEEVEGWGLGCGWSLDPREIWPMESWHSSSPLPNNARAVLVYQVVFD
jgi:hypothetical protein